MISDLIRPVWTWALWNWRRLAITLLAACALTTVTVRAIEATTGAPTPTARHPAPATSARQSATAPSSADLAAAESARRFAAAWVSHQAGWARLARRYATPALAARLTTGDHSYLPATTVTGPPAITAATPTSVTASVPTNAGPADITVTRDGQLWLASAVHLTRAGD